MILMILYVGGILLQLVTMLLHGIGLYFLRCLRINGRGDVQLTYITNLSIMELFTTFCFLVETGLNLTMSLTDFQLNTFNCYIDIILLTFCSLLLYMNMLYIVIDKAMEVFWNIKYSLYWSVEKAKYLEIITWSVGLFICFGVTTAYNLGFHYVPPFAYYFRPCLDIVFLITIVVSYGYIFHKYRQSRDIPTETRHRSTTTTLPSCKQSLFTIFRNRRVTSANQQSLFSTFRNLRFYISICLVLNFSLFTIIPDYLQFFMNAKQEGKTKYALRVILYTISFVSDACIYILINTQVKVLLYKKLHTIRCLHNSIPNNVAEN